MKGALWRKTTVRISLTIIKNMNLSIYLNEERKWPMSEEVFVSFQYLMMMKAKAVMEFHSAPPQDQRGQALKGTTHTTR